MHKQARTIRSVLRQAGAPAVIDYWSLDTEGSELAILRSFPFDEYRFRVLTVEHNDAPVREDIRQYLAERGYTCVRALGIDDAYVWNGDLPSHAWRSAMLGASGARADTEEELMDSRLANQQYVVVEGFIDTRLARILYDMLLFIRHWRQEFKRDDQVPNANSHWGDSTLDALLVGLLPDVESASGCALLPTCFYARLYLQGQALPRHRDRAACEIAVTVHLGSADRQPPPLQLPRTSP